MTPQQIRKPIREHDGTPPAEAKMARSSLIFGGLSRGKQALQHQGFLSAVMSSVRICLAGHAIGESVHPGHRVITVTTIIFLDMSKLTLK
jgi:hypothetical protein